MKARSCESQRLCERIYSTSSTDTGKAGHGLVSLFGASCIWSALSLARNHAIDRKIGFPIIVSPVTSLNPFWIIFGRTCPSVLNLLKRLPLGRGVWARCTYIGWCFDDKHALHCKYGSVFIIVTPGGNEIIVANPAIAHKIFARRKEFIKPAIVYDQLNVFGLI